MRSKAVVKGAKVRRARKMNPVVKGLLIVALIYVAGNMIATCVKLQLQRSEKKSALDEEQQKISMQTVYNEELTDVLNGKTDIEYVEKIAREKGYVSQGERVYENITDE